MGSERVTFVIMDLDIEFRTPGADDLAFVFDSWMDSFKFAHAAGVIPMDMYRDIYTEVIRRVLLRSKTVVAYNAQIPSQLLGFATAETDIEVPIVYYTVVKQFIRRQGLARRMLAEVGVDPRKPFFFPFKSRIAGELLQSWSGGRFDPIMARKILEKHP